ncbi:MAG: M48 family metallopeptidase [Alistipes sp.]|nr:M48 family metallopeptidase [Alistipes sp.]
MTQERFSTLEECCEFVRLFSQLAEQKSKEEINNDVIDMHIALTKHIDEYVNRFCARHELKCSVSLNYRIRALGYCCGTRRIILNPELLFYGANYFREVILHELAHLTNRGLHTSNFWRTHIAYLQEEGLLPQGKILESQVIKQSNTVSYKNKWYLGEWWSEIKPSIQLTLNGEPIVDLYSHNTFKDLYGTYFHMHNPSLRAKLSVDDLQHLQTVEIMRAIIRKAIKQQLNINIMA